MRRLLPAALVLLVALAGAATAQPAVTFVVKGNGWGHGIGLPQWGAYGYARDEGKTYDWILAHYYPGTELGAAGVGRVRVLLTEGRTEVRIGSAADFTVTDAAGKTYALAAGSQLVKANLQIVSRNGQTRTLVAPARFQPGTSPLTLGGNGYRDDLLLHKSGGRLSVVNDIGLEKYVRGVVAWEMPSTWHAEALKAQAVIARTYGLVSRKSGGIFDLYPDTRSQVYGGVRAETSATNAAVSGTSGQVLRAGGALAWTFYHSTSGGKTAAINDVWPAGTAQTYLQSAADPHSTISPHHRWGPTDLEVDCVGTSPDCVWRGNALKARLGSRAPAGLSDLTVKRNASSRVATVTATGSGGTRSFSGAELQAALGLRSSWFTIGRLRITAAKRSIEWGKAAKLAVSTRSVAGAMLQRRRPGLGWEDMRRVKGSESVKVSPTVTTRYRLSSPSGTTAAVRIAVQPQVRFAQVQRAGSLFGVIGPRYLTGGPVLVQRRTAAGTWKTVAVTTVSADGTWRAFLAVRSGVYRAHAPATASYAAGSSPALTVVLGQ